MEKVLYHYTSTYHLPAILRTEYLKLTESNLKAPTQEEVVNLLKYGGYDSTSLYKPCVWLTTSNKTEGHGLDGSAVDKTEIKITVRWQKDFQNWKVWSRANGINKKWAKALEKGRNSNSWWISEKPILFADIIQIENTITKEIYFTNEGNWKDEIIPQNFLYKPMVNMAV